MSVNENAKKLVAKLKADPTLAKKFQEAGETGFEKLAAAQGLPCTAAEMKAAIGAARSNSQLSDQDLDKVAGGGIATVGIF